jgi:mobilome CxxCx(11)CxxC protein
VASPAQIDPRTDECRKRRTDAAATAAIFRRRAKKYSSHIDLLTFTGIAVPVLIGCVVSADLLKNPLWMSRFLWVAGVVAAVQIIVSLWSIVAKWPDKQESSLSSATANSRFETEFEELLNQLKDPPLSFDKDFAKLKAQDDMQILADERQFITNEEKVFGYRANLHRYGEKCGKCAKVPDSPEIPGFIRKRSRCDYCGGPK